MSGPGEGRWIWCPRCGLLPWRLAVVVNPGGQYIPFKHLECSQCGKRVDWVCRGDESVCEVRDRICMFHGCYVAGDPRKKAALALVAAARAREAAEAEESGLWGGPAVGWDGEASDPAKGGIFG